MGLDWRRLRQGLRSFAQPTNPILTRPEVCLGLGVSITGLALVVWPAPAVVAVLFIAGGLTALAQQADGGRRRERWQRQALARGHADIALCFARDQAAFGALAWGHGLSLANLALRLTSPPQAAVVCAMWAVASLGLACALLRLARLQRQLHRHFAQSPARSF